jgi:hypothetical protein
MNKKIIFTVIAVAVITVAAFVLINKIKNSPGGQTQNTVNNKAAVKLSPLDAKYWIESQLISLKDGKAETVSPYSKQKQTTQIVGTPVSGDLNSDGQADWAVIITQKFADDPGVYYYAAIALVDNKKGIIVGSNAVAIGDRINLKNVAIVNDAVKIDYLDWKTNGDAVESFPTNPVSKSFILDGVMFKELTNKRASAQVEAACTDKGGTWIKTSNECKGLDKDWCAKTGGQFSGAICKF